jgi:aromatic ring-opening dioxygenase catalytic subunit (LigB family)
MRIPTLYIPHGGGPCFFMDWSMGPKDTWERLRAWLAALLGSLPERPQALLVISAHWEQPVPTVTTSPSPPMLFDYYGFPPQTYELRWPAPGDPELAARVRALLAAAGLPSTEDGRRGYDHGVFVPLLVALPDASIPTVQLSLQRGLDPAFHLALGRALEPLRDEGVLILGSGMSYHDMGGFGGPWALALSKQFDAWLAETVALPKEERERRLERWEEAPAARRCHPREEHLLPLMVVAGAAGQDAGAAVFADVVMGAWVSAQRFG